MYSWSPLTVGVSGGVVVTSRGDGLSSSFELSLGTLEDMRWRRGVGGEFVEDLGVLDGEERRLCAEDEPDGIRRVDE